MLQPDPILFSGGALQTAWNAARGDREHERFAKYRDDPVGFVEEVMGDSLWGAEDSPTGKPGQKEILGDLSEHRRVTVRACHGMGKTYLAARAALWFWITRPNSIVVSTASSWEQVRNLLWRELRAAHTQSLTPLPGRILTTNAEMTGADSELWYMVGFSTNNPIRAQGKHAQGGVLFIVDEASGVPDEIYEVTRGYGTQGESMVLEIGNPNAREGKFYEHHQDSSLYRKFHVSAYDVPREFNGASLMDPQWIEDMRADCGPSPEDDPMFQVQVLGEWPSSDAFSLIPLTALEAAKNMPGGISGLTMGVDIARDGGDFSVAYLNDNGRLKARHAWQGAKLFESGAIIAELIEKWGVRPEDCKVEVDGIGAGAVDDLYRRGIYVEPVRMGDGPKGDWPEVTARYSFPPGAGGRRAELHCIARQLIYDGRLVVPERYKGAWSDLTQLRQVASKQGHFLVEEKAKFKSRVGRSPDDSDAILLSLSRAGGPNRVRMGTTSRRRTRSLRTRPRMRA